MDEDTPQPEPEKPRFLLPDGCKDLIDALRLQQQQPEEAELPEPGISTPADDTPQPLPASVALPDPVIVRDLAFALHLKPFQVVGSLMQFNVFASLNTALDFNTASTLCSHYGVAATKVA
jgi:hypothetical protein